MYTQLNATLSALAIALKLLSANLDALEKAIPSYEVVIEVPTSTAPTIQELIIKYFPENPEALDIFRCESNLNPEAQNLKDPFGGSHGVAQVNGIHGHPVVTLLDPNENLRIAKELFDKESWKPWSCAKILGYL